jgi:predicted TIM-barrel fold metal-dependent hydrolase
MDVTDKSLEELNDQGITGVRLNMDNIGGMPIGLDQIPELEARIKGLGWHMEYLFPGKDIVDLAPIFKKSTIPVSIAHFAYQPAANGIESEGFKTLLNLVKDGNTWIKISGANRVSKTDLPPYDDVMPMARALVEANPENIMWGTDWPHPNKYEVNPNDGDLVNAFGEWITDEEMRKKILVTNPEKFYSF